MTRRRANPIMAIVKRGPIWPRECGPCGYDIRQTIRDGLRRCPECGAAIKKVDPEPLILLERYPLITHIGGLVPTMFLIAVPWIGFPAGFEIGASCVGMLMYLVIWAAVAVRTEDRSIDPAMAATLFFIAVVINGVLGLTGCIVSGAIAAQI